MLPLGSHSYPSTAQQPLNRKQATWSTAGLAISEEKEIIQQKRTANLLLQVCLNVHKLPVGNGLPRKKGLGLCLCWH